MSFASFQVADGYQGRGQNMCLPNNYRKVLRLLLSHSLQESYQSSYEACSTPLPVNSLTHNGVWFLHPDSL